MKKTITLSIILTLVIMAIFYFLIPLISPKSISDEATTKFSEWSFFDTAYAGIASKPYTFAPGQVIYSARVNTNFDNIFNEFNGNIESSNILNNTILDADINTTGITTAGKVTDTAIIGTEWDDLTDGGTTVLHAHSGFTGTASFASITGSITAAQHGDLSSSTSTMHSASSVVLTDAGGYYTASTVEQAMQEVGNHIATMSAAISSGEVNSWGILYDRDAGACYASPTQFSVYDAGYSIPTSEGTIDYTRFITPTVLSSFMFGIQYTAVATYTANIRGLQLQPSSEAFIYLDGTLIYELSSDGNGDLRYVDYALSPHTGTSDSPSAGVLTIVPQLPSGTHIVEVVWGTSAVEGRLSLVGNWFATAPVTSWAAYRRY